jgi:hypothetical protein
MLQYPASRPPLLDGLAVARNLPCRTGAVMLNPSPVAAHQHRLGCESTVPAEGGVRVLYEYFMVHYERMQGVL